MDPRIEADGVSKEDIESQIAMQNKVIDLLSEARQLQADLKGEAKNLKGKSSPAQKERLSKVNTVIEKLENADGAYPQQMLVSQISYLLNMISYADQLPGQEAENRLKELEAQFDMVKQEIGD